MAKVKMKVGGNDLKYDIQEELYFDIDTVFTYFGKQAGLVAWWKSLVSTKDKELKDAKVMLAKLSAEIELNLRQNQDAIAAQYGKVTEGVIKALIASNETLVADEMKINILARDVGLLKAMADGFEGRSVLLATAGSAQKSEIAAHLRDLTGRTEKRSENLQKD